MNANEPPPRAAELSQLEIAYGVPTGYARSRAPLTVAAPATSPRHALEAVLTAALRRAPCAVSFSGGRDSSALLTIATKVARRDGLPDPIPVTLRFPGSAETDEAAWQELVLERLRLRDWVRIDVHGDEFDAVGPVARRLLSMHGLLWPFNTHFHAPIVESVAGGSLVTGFGGDEIGLSSATARAEQVLSMRRRPNPADVLTVGLALSPYRIRKAVHRRRIVPDAGGLPWLTRNGVRAVTSAAAASAASVPLGWSRVLLEAVWRSRYFLVCQENFAAMGASSDVQVHHPFVAAPVLGALANAGGFGGLRSRTDVMRLLCEDDLPSAVVSRNSKGTFRAPVFTDTARAFAQQWSGGGVDPQMVDADALRSHWAGDHVNLLSLTLMQAAWLHDHPKPEHASPDESSPVVSGHLKERGHGFVNA